METTFDTAVKSALRLSSRLLITPVRTVVHFFAPWQQTVADQPAASQQRMGSHFMVNAANKDHYAPPSNTSVARHCDHRELRVLRVIDASCSRHSAGRMKISGRFTEVCAELDRLSQQEAA